MTDITDASKIYIRLQNGSDYDKIEAEMGRFTPAAHEDLEKPIKKGTICAARFKVDDNWYRAKVLHSTGKGEFEVQFIDFGNTEIVNGNIGDLKRLPESLLKYEPQAKLGSLAFIKAPKASTELGDEAAQLIQAAALDAVTDAIIVDSSYSNALQVVLFPTKSERDWNRSLNSRLIQKGLAGLRVSSDEGYPDEINAWFKFEEDARENQIGIWQFGGAEAFDEEAE